MERPSLNELVLGMDDMATLPATIVDLLCLLDNPLASADSVLKILERDVAMTANILKLGNSAYYGSRRKIPTVRLALVLLGNRSVAALSFAAGMAPIMRRDLDCYHLSKSDFWEHSLVCAAASSLAADRLGIGQLRCEAYTLGLIHDVGMMIIDNWLVQNDQTLVLSENDQDDYCAAEIGFFGFDHATVGAALARAWGFPENFAQVIGHHHDSPGALVYLPDNTAKLARAVAAGSLIARLKNVKTAQPEAMGKLQELGINPTSLDELRLALAENLEETLTSATRVTVPN